MTSAYAEFIHRKSQYTGGNGFKPTFIPDCAFDFQRHLIEWSVGMGRSLTAADCGLGKTLMQLAFAENVIRHTNRPVLLLTPIAVGSQTLREAEKFGVTAKKTRDGVCDGKPVIWITNYEQLHKYDPSMFAGVVGDESSGIKDFKSKRKSEVVEFSRRMDYRGLYTATAAPNDFWELGTSSEALGYLGFRDMITTFFKQETSKDHLGWGRTKYRFRGHAEQPFWSWVCSWARSLRMPSDLGFSDDGFVLPPLIEREIIVECKKARKGRLFPLPGLTLHDEKEERRNSIVERCEKACDIAVNHDGQTALWCELNPEGDMLEKIVPDSAQVSGSTRDEEKEELFDAFSLGQLKRIICKPKIGAWGLNWQNCNNIVELPSHSFERHYQLVRRCYRFGQKKPVTVSLVVNEGEVGILENLRRKGSQADRMFASIVAHMKDAMRLSGLDFYPETEEVPAWL